MATAHLQSSPSGGEDCGASAAAPAAVGLDLDRGRRELLDLRRGGWLTSEQVGGIQHEFLLDAVSEIVAERGYRAATMGGVCDRAGVSGTTFYERFPNLDACIAAAVDRAHVRVVDAAKVGYAHGAGERWPLRVHAAVVEVLALLDAQPALARLVAVQAPAGSQPVRAAHGRLIAGLAEMLTATSVSEPAGGLPGRVAEGLIGGAWAMLYQQLIEDGDRAPLLSSAGELAYLLCVSLSSIPAALPLLCAPAVPVREWSASMPASADGVRWRADVAGDGTRKRALRFIAEHPGASNQQISEHMGTSPSTTSRRLASMARDRLIHSEPRGPRHAWSITRQGERVLVDPAAAHR